MTTCYQMFIYWKHNHSLQKYDHSLKYYPNVNEIEPISRHSRSVHVNLDLEFVLGLAVGE